MSEHKCSCHEHKHNDEHKLDGERKVLSLSVVSYVLLLFADYLFYMPYLMRGLFLVLYIVVGHEVIRAAIKSIKNRDFFNEFTLMSLATIVAIVINQMPEAVGVMLFYRVGEYLQELASERSRKSIKELLTSKPEAANLLVGDEVRQIGVEEIEVGQRFLVKSGEKVPTDGLVLNGISRVDTSSLTGEFMPVGIKEGDQVLGGYINIGNVIVVEAVKRFQDTSIAKTMELVEHSSKHKAPTEKFIHKFSRYYTPVVFVLALVVALLPPLALGLSWETWIYRALVMLVISCPCALVISIPLSYFASIGIASRKGILVKGGVVMDVAREVSVAVFDKTGTLTKGKFEVSKIVPAEGVLEVDLLRMALMVEGYSNHPIAAAIVKLGERGKVSENVDVRDIAGKGLVLKEGKNIYLAGNYALMKDFAVEVIDSDEAGTVVYFAENGKYKGYMVLNDALKKGAKELIVRLKKAGMKIFMLTGDNEKAAGGAAEVLDLDGFKAGLMPEDKLKEVEKAARQGKVMFVGDGVNDAPVLSAVDLGVAMGGGGAKLAVEVADAVILNDDIEKVGELINLGRKTHKIVWQNIILALGVKTLFMALGVVGLSGLWEAVFADVGVSLLAIFNALRLAR